MVTNRYLEEKDIPLLTESLKNDEFHQGTTAEFFQEKDTVCSVYEDEEGPVLFLRGQVIDYYNHLKIIRLDIQYLNNKDARRNMRVMLEGFPELELKAKENGFQGFFFISNVPLLRKFCVKRLGFQEMNDDVLYKIIDEDVNAYLHKN
jgi:hypothetical protein